jgi:hypothetical protein
MLDEFFQMVIYGTVFPVTALAFHLAHLFGVILGLSLAFDGTATSWQTLLNR